MCGIVGYIGTKPAEPILLSGLKRLEYRGYDSAGIAVTDGKAPRVTKTKGKVSDLTALLQKKPLKGQLGIGHTRWATHGEPNTTNAHPHQAGQITLVHNGIIENYAELRRALEAKGRSFRSQTDTEVLAQLIDYEYEKSKTFETALLRALKKVRGTYGTAILVADQPGVLFAARRGSPLIIGSAADGVLIGSDATALIGHARHVAYLNDDEVVRCNSDGTFEVLDMAQGVLDRELESLDLEVETVQKQGYDHFLIKEVMEQPDSVRSTLSGRLDLASGTSHLGGLNLEDSYVRELERILIVGCGTAYYAGILGKYLLERLLDLPVDVEVASEFRYRGAATNGHTLGIAISQSGETADTLASVRELKARGIPTVGLVNAVGSTIAREVDGGIYLHVGPEISVASTKAFTSQVVALVLLGLHLARRRGLSAQEGAEIVRALDHLPTEIEAALKLNDATKKAAQQLAKHDHAFYMGRDTLYPIALEGALKLKEVSYVHAEGYAAGEMKHGPIALIDKSLYTVFLLAKGAMSEKARTNLQELQARGGPVLLVTDDKKQAEQGLFVKTTSDWTAPLVINVVLQMLAYHTAVKRGCDVDQPRNLAKSVTVE